MMQRRPVSSGSLDRRGFVKGTALAAAGAFIGAEGVGRGSIQPGPPANDPPEKTGMVLEKWLGKTGIKVSALGVGGYHLGSAKDQQEASTIVARAWMRG